jgi:hypothetical protein
VDKAKPPGYFPRTATYNQTTNPILLLPASSPGLSRPKTDSISSDAPLHLRFFAYLISKIEQLAYLPNMRNVSRTFDEWIPDDLLNHIDHNCISQETRAVSLRSSSPEVNSEVFTNLLQLKDVLCNSTPLTRGPLAVPQNRKSSRLSSGGDSTRSFKQRECVPRLVFKVVDVSCVGEGPARLPLPDSPCLHIVKNREDSTPMGGSLGRDLIPRPIALMTGFVYKAIEQRI